MSTDLAETTPEIAVPTMEAPAPVPVSSVAHRVKKDPINGDALGTGRRKTSVARVRIRAGSGKITVNGRDLPEFFPNLQDQNNVTSGLDLVGKRTEVDVIIQVRPDRAIGRLQDGNRPGLGELRHRQLPAAAGKRAPDARLAHEGAQEVRPPRRPPRNPVLQAVTSRFRPITAKPPATPLAVSRAQLSAGASRRSLQPASQVAPAPPSAPTSIVHRLCPIRLKIPGSTLFAGVAVAACA
jgi:hypothetical protein